MGAAGLGYITFINNNGTLEGKGPIAKFIPPRVLELMSKKCDQKIAWKHIRFQANLQPNAHPVRNEFQRREEAKNHRGGLRRRRRRDLPIQIQIPRSDLKKSSFVITTGSKIWYDMVFCF